MSRDELNDRGLARARHARFGKSRTTHADDGFDPHRGINEYYGSQAVVEMREDSLGGTSEAGVSSHDDLTDVSADDHHDEDHQSRHNSGGADALKLDDLADPDDNTDLNASASVHGLLPKLPDRGDQVFLGDGTWGQVNGTAMGAVQKVYAYLNFR